MWCWSGQATSQTGDRTLQGGRSPSLPGPLLWPRKRSPRQTPRSISGPGGKAARLSRRVPALHLPAPRNHWEGPRCPATAGLQSQLSRDLSEPLQLESSNGAPPPASRSTGPLYVSQDLPWGQKIRASRAISRLHCGCSEATVAAVEVSGAAGTGWRADPNLTRRSVAASAAPSLPAARAVLTEPAAESAAVESAAGQDRKTVCQRLRTRSSPASAPD